MNKEEAQKVVRKYLNESDSGIFDGLVEALKDPDLITQEEMAEGAVKLTELFDRNNIQIVGAPNRKINQGGFSPMELHVLYKGKEVT